MTYKELLNAIFQLTEEQLESQAPQEAVDQLFPPEVPDGD